MKSWIRVKYSDIKNTIVIFDKALELVEQKDIINQIEMDPNDNILVSFDSWPKLHSLFTDCDYVDEYIETEKTGCDFLDCGWKKEFNDKYIFEALGNFIGKDTKYHYKFLSDNFNRIGRTTLDLKNTNKDKVITFLCFKISEFGTSGYSSEAFHKLVDIIMRRFSNRLTAEDKELLNGYNY